LQYYAPYRTGAQSRFDRLDVFYQVVVSRRPKNVIPLRGITTSLIPSLTFYFESRVALFILSPDKVGVVGWGAPGYTPRRHFFFFFNI
jgi:hypothetical protein